MHPPSFRADTTRSIRLETTWLFRMKVWRPSTCVPHPQPSEMAVYPVSATLLCEMVVSRTYPAKMAAAPRSSSAANLMVLSTTRNAESIRSGLVARARSSSTFPSLTAPPASDVKLLPTTDTCWLAPPTDRAYALPKLAKEQPSTATPRARPSETAPGGSPSGVTRLCVGTYPSGVEGCRHVACEKASRWKEWFASPSAWRIASCSGAHASRGGPPYGSRGR
mmetsp:Transcript_23058/g.68004  ORF Transcript_23058/g.68004 Transcript_23058/m.68004 type:complete len:222 (-) Transcript_23058:764-1429(-)